MKDVYLTLTNYSAHVAFLKCVQAKSFLSSLTELFRNIFLESIPKKRRNFLLVSYLHFFRMPKIFLNNFFRLLT